MNRKIHQFKIEAIIIKKYDFENELTHFPCLRTTLELAKIGRNKVTKVGQIS